MAAALRHRIRRLLNRYCRRGIAVGGFDDMFITCACTLSSSSHDAPLVLQAEELAGAQRCRCQQRHTGAIGTTHSLHRSSSQMLCRCEMGILR